MGKSASDVTMKQRLQDHIEKNIKKCILMSHTTGLLTNGEQEAKRRKVKNSDIGKRINGNEEIIEVEDISDNETVVTSSSAKTNDDKMETTSGGWETVVSTKNKRKEMTKKNEIISVLKSNRKYILKDNGMTNGDYNGGKLINENEKYERGNEKAKTEEKVSKAQYSSVGQQSRIPTFLEAVKGKKRSENNFQVRLNFSYKPRTTTKGDVKRVATELLQIAMMADDKALLMPWQDQEDGDYGPINLEDMMNPKSFINEITQYIHKPRYVNLVPGQTAYKMGVRFTISVPRIQFLRRWNSLKQHIKETRKSFYSVSFAPMQYSSESYLIGIAAGSSEEQDTELINQRLSEVTGIQGIEVSFQNVNQIGITNEFWKMANEKAEATMAYRNSREYLRCKYKWAPNAIAIYVPKAGMVTEARKTMIRMFGKETGKGDPRWPDGTRMRFLPLKNGVIHSERTRAIVKKRLAYHIWLKAHDRIKMTNFKNIHSGSEIFGGFTFSEKVLSLANESERDTLILRHFKRGWSNNPNKETWLMALNPDNVSQANEFLRNIYDKMKETYV